jgi:hypothetical protein
MIFRTRFLYLIHYLVTLKIISAKESVAIINCKFDQATISVCSWGRQLIQCPKPCFVFRTTDGQVHTNPKSNTVLFTPLWWGTSMSESNLDTEYAFRGWRTYEQVEVMQWRLTYLLTPWSRVLLEKLTLNFAASQEIPYIYGTRNFLTVPTSARHLSLSWANSIQSPRPPSTSWRPTLILSSHLRLGFHNDLFPSGFPTNTLCTPLSFPIRATCPAHLIRLDFTVD